MGIKHIRSAILLCRIKVVLAWNILAICDQRAPLTDTRACKIFCCNNTEIAPKHSPTLWLHARKLHLQLMMGKGCFGGVLFPLNRLHQQLPRYYVVGDDRSLTISEKSFYMVFYGSCLVLTCQIFGVDSLYSRLLN